MGLTKIAKELKSIFPEYKPPTTQDLVKEFRVKHPAYLNVESIRIRGVNYIVIDDKYKHTQSGKSNVSPLFNESITSGFAIIDPQTSSTLIDEVYARVAYLQRDCRLDKGWKQGGGLDRLKDTIENDLGVFVDGDTEKIVNVRISESSENANNADNVSIFQCHLLKDTGVSATPDSYSFMLKANGEIQELSAAIMRQVGNKGAISELRDNGVLQKKNEEIQKAIFDKYSNLERTEIDISSITVKSIFEILTNSIDAKLEIADDEDKAVFSTTYIASKNNACGKVNQHIHRCNCCGGELADSHDMHHLHINIDALDKSSEGASDEDVYATGCDKCLEQCPICGKWHFKYKDANSRKLYADVKFAGRRGAIRHMRRFVDDINYCSCREGIEWVYDDMVYNATDGMIPVARMAFVNSANEVIANYNDYSSFCKTLKMDMPGTSRISAFKNELAVRLQIKADDIRITSASKCKQCHACNSYYYIRNKSNEEYYCPVCNEMKNSGKHVVTRSDGIVFMRRKVNGAVVTNRYVLTRLGNLRQLQVTEVDLSDDYADMAEDSDEQIEQQSTN